MNQYVCTSARSSSDIAVPASPVSGSGVPVPRFDQLFLLALQEGKTTAGAQVTFAWNLLLGLGQRISKEGKVLESADENIAHLTKMAELFASKQLPILRALEIA